MSRENVKKFYEMLKVDANLAQELMKLKEELEKGDKKFLNDEYVINEKIIPLAKKHGFDFTADEFTAYSKEQLSKLSEEELLNVTGGTGVVGAIGGVLLSIFSMFGFGANSTTSSTTNSTTNSSAPVITLGDSTTNGTSTTTSKQTLSEISTEVRNSTVKVKNVLLPDLKSKLNNAESKGVKEIEDIYEVFKDNALKKENEELRTKVKELENQNNLMNLSKNEEGYLKALAEKNEKIEALKLKADNEEDRRKDMGEKNERLNETIGQLKNNIKELEEDNIKLKSDYNKLLTQYQTSLDKMRAEIRNKNDLIINQIKSEHIKEIKNLLDRHSEEIKKIRESNEESFQKYKESSEKDAKKIKNKYEAIIVKKDKDHKEEMEKFKKEFEERYKELINGCWSILDGYNAETLELKKVTEDIGSSYNEIIQENKNNSERLEKMERKLNVNQILQNEIYNDKSDLEKEKEDFNKEKAEFNKLKEATYTSFTSSKLDEQARHLIEFLKERSFYVNINDKNLIKDIKHVVGQMKEDDDGTVYLHSKGVGYGILGTDYYASGIGIDQEDLNKLYEFYEIVK